MSTYQGSKNIQIKKYLEDDGSIKYVSNELTQDEAKALFERVK